MQKKKSSASVVFGAVVIALIAGVTGWSMHSRVASNRPPVAQAGSNDASPDGHTGMAAVATSQRSDQTAKAFLSAMKSDPRGFMQANDASISKLVNAGRQKLRSRYANEKVDSAWASRKQMALTAASTSVQMEQIGAKPLSFDSQCRTSVCLIGADFASSSTADDWFTLYTLVAAPDMTNAAVSRSTNPDGTIHLQIYGLARK